MNRQRPIEDYYGTQIEVEIVDHSAGRMVDLSRDWTACCDIEFGARVRGDFDSFTPGQARDLARRLTDAADEIEGRS